MVSREQLVLGGEQHPRADVHSHAGSGRRRFAESLRPRLHGRPRRRWVLAFPALLVVVFAVLVGAGITGSSSGVLRGYYQAGADPDLISGMPQVIRSDEYAVQTAWTISQVEQGLPTRNHTFPGGTDATVQSDLPSRDWSVWFRPHLVAFQWLPLDQAMAWKWWLPGFAMMAACYAFVLALLPHRPLSAAMLSVGFFFMPFLQWWFLPVSFWPMAWAFATLAGAISLSRGPLRIRLVVPWGAVIAYLTVTMIIGVYVPFIVPPVLVVVAGVIGIALGAPGISSPDARSRLLRLAPVAVSAVVAAAVVGIWIVTRLGTIESFLNTSYPGQRFVEAGSIDRDTLATFFSAPFSRPLGIVAGAPFSANSSESAAFFVPGLFLLIGVPFVVIRTIRRHSRQNWFLICMALVTALFALFAFVPATRPLAHALQLDRVPMNRLQVGTGLLSIVIIVLWARSGWPRLRRSPHVIRIVVVLGASTLSALSVAVIAVYLLHRSSPLVLGSKSWIILGVATALIALFAACGRILPAAALTLICSMLTGWGVNPAYRGVYDINDTRLVRTMETLQLTQRGRWVGVGDAPVPVNLALVESGLPGYNGFQNVPSRSMWHQIDPGGQDRFSWNRLANISWIPGTGDPEPRNPAPDQILLTFDSCSRFAQEHVTWVLANQALDQACLTPVDRVVQGPSTFEIYRVAKG